MAGVLQQRNSVDVPKDDADDFAPRTHVLFANTVVCSMCDAFDLYWEPEVSQSYRNFHGLARYSRISDCVLQEIRILILFHNEFKMTTEDLTADGLEIEDLSNFIDANFQPLLLLRGEKSMRKVMYAVACVVGVCINLQRDGYYFAPSLCAARLGKLMQALDKEWNGEIYSRLDDYARRVIERSNPKTY